jgi:hypothetical protein
MYLKSFTAWWYIFSISKKGVTLLPSPYTCHRELAQSEYTKMALGLRTTANNADAVLLWRGVYRNGINIMTSCCLFCWIRIRVSICWVTNLHMDPTRAATTNARFSAVHIPHSKS